MKKYFPKILSDKIYYHIFIQTLLLFVLFLSNNFLIAQQQKDLQFEHFLTQEQNLKDDIYYKNRIMFKTKTIQKIDKKSNVFLSSDIATLLSQIDANITSIAAPYAKYYNEFGGQLQASSNGLERICEATFDKDIDILTVCSELMQNENIEYAEPIPIYKTFEWKPNDPQINKQWHLQDLDIYKAWEVVKDKTNVVIGVIDSGTDIEHPDLKANSWSNPNEVLDGVDNDKNGKIDDIKGWDFVGNISVQDANNGNFRPDNNVIPSNAQNLHGTHVAGLIAATANNGIMGTGTSGLNCNYIATKHGIDGGDGGIYEPYKGIMYCIELGAKIINCSWGSIAYSKAYEEVVTEAISKGATIFIASGNDGTDNDIVPQYPANYPDVISVGATNISGKPASFTCYGYSTHLFAPGEKIYSTLPNNNFGEASGTSMATPITTGVAALVKTVFPQYTAKQLYHQFRSTKTQFKSNTDKYKYCGKINAYNAVTYNNPAFPDKIIPGVAVSKIELPPFNAFTSYKPKKLKLELTNYIGKAKNLVVKVSSLDKLVDITANGENTVGVMDSMGVKNIEINVQLNAKTAISDGKAQFLIEYTDGNFSDYEVIYVPINISTPAKTNATIFYGASDQIGPNSVTVTDMQCYEENATIATGYQSKMQGACLRPYIFIANDGNSYTQPTQIQMPSINNIFYSIPKAIFAMRNLKKIFVGSEIAVNDSSVYISSSSNSNLYTWQNVNVSQIAKRISKIHFFDDQNGVFLGTIKGDLTMGASYDGGSSWKNVDNLPKLLPGETIEAQSGTAKNNMFWIGTNKGRILCSKDKGTTWNINTIDTNMILSSIAFSDDNKGLAILYSIKDFNCYLAKTIDGGTKWTYSQFVNLNENGILPKFIYAVNNTDIFVVATNNNAIFATNDFGNKWKNVNAKHTFASTFIGAVNTKNGNNNQIKIKSLGHTCQYNSNKYYDYKPYMSLVTTTITEPFFDVVRSVKLQPTSILNFGNIDLGKDTAREISMQNTGDAALSFSDYIIIPDNDETNVADFKIVSYPSNISVGKTSNIRIVFTPKTKGNKLAKLFIANNTDKYPEIEFILKGTAIFNEFAEITSNKFEVAFDTTSTSNTNQQNIVITNIGNTNVKIDSMIFEPLDQITKAEDFSIASSIVLPIDLTPKGKVTIPIIFNPKTGGNKEANLVIKNTGSTPNLTVNIKGIAIAGDGIYDENYNVFSQIIPNPAKDVCYSTIYLNKMQFYSVELIDAKSNSLGVIQEGIGNEGELQLEIKTNKLPSGTYFLILNLADKKYINKFIINR